jgi:hypothetical protein
MPGDLGGEDGGDDDDDPALRILISYIPMQFSYALFAVGGWHIWQHLTPVASLPPFMLHKG